MINAQRKDQEQLNLNPDIRSDLESFAKSKKFIIPLISEEMLAAYVEWVEMSERFEKIENRSEDMPIQEPMFLIKCPRGAKKDLILELNKKHQRQRKIEAVGIQKFLGQFLAARMSESNVGKRRRSSMVTKGSSFLSQLNILGRKNRRGKSHTDQAQNVDRSESPKTPFGLLLREWKISQIPDEPVTRPLENLIADQNNLKDPTCEPRTHFILKKQSMLNLRSVRSSDIGGKKVCKLALTATVQSYQDEFVSILFL